MHYLVQPAPLSGGTVTVPGDKSISHRALMLGALADGDCLVTGFLQGEDCKATLAALRAMGIAVDLLDGTTLRVHGGGMRGFRQPASTLDLGNSGTAMRLFCGMLCGQPFPTTLVGDGSLMRRPMGRVIEPLGRMGARIDSNAGLPPLTVHGGSPLKAIHYLLPVASAQVKSAILLAGLYADGVTSIVEPAPTRDHTELMLRSLGVEVEAGEGHIRMRGGQVIRPADIQVPADLSSAAFLVLGALLSPGCELVLRGVGINPTRTGVLEILRQMGASIDIENAGSSGLEPVADLRVRYSRLRGTDVDPALVSLAIDEFPVLFVAAAAARGRTVFTGIGELRVKESDRISSMAQGLRQLGIEVQESADGAIIEGGSFSGGVVDSFGDHRVAMSLAVAATVADAPVTVLDTDTVDTSFPGFVECLRSAGAQIGAHPEAPAP